MNLLRLASPRVPKISRQCLVSVQPYKCRPICQWLCHKTPIAKGCPINTKGLVRKCGPFCDGPGCRSHSPRNNRYHIYNRGAGSDFGTVLGAIYCRMCGEFTGFAYQTVPASDIFLNNRYKNDINPFSPLHLFPLPVQCSGVVIIQYEEWLVPSPKYFSDLTRNRALI